MIEQDYSPEQVAGLLKKNGGTTISHEWIYQFIWRDKKQQGTLHTHLRHKGRRYRKRGSSKDSRGKIVGRIGIEKRPKEAEDRKVFGHLEVDTIIGQNHKGAIITNASLRWQAMTFPTKELMLFEEIEDDTRQIADAFDFPMHLLGFKKGTTYANVNEAKKSFYQDATIPEAENFANAFAQYFDLPDGLRLVPSYDHLEIFQKSRKDQAEVVRIICEGYKTAYEKGIVTLEEWRSAMNLDPNNFTGNTFYEPPAEPSRMLQPVNQDPKQ